MTYNQAEETAKIAQQTFKDYKENKRAEKLEQKEIRKRNNSGRVIKTFKSTTHRLKAVSLQLQPFEPVAATIGRLTPACPRIP